MNELHCTFIHEQSSIWWMNTCTDSSVWNSHQLHRVCGNISLTTFRCFLFSPHLSNEITIFPRKSLYYKVYNAQCTVASALDYGTTQSLSTASNCGVWKCLALATPSEFVVLEPPISQGEPPPKQEISLISIKIVLGPQVCWAEYVVFKTWRQSKNKT